MIKQERKKLKKKQKKEQKAIKEKKKKKLKEVQDQKNQLKRNEKLRHFKDLINQTQDFLCMKVQRCN